MASKQFEKSEVSHPWFWIIAGPNGVGKSTWATSEESADVLGSIPILNPDHYIEPYVPNPLSLITAGRKIFHKITDLISIRQSFAVETTFSGTQHLRLAQKLKQDSWNIGSVFIGVDGADICISRVEERKLGGGHDVPLKDILRRYGRSYEHIPHLLNISNYMIILDNSYIYKQILEKNEQEILIKKELPLWLKRLVIR